MPTEAPAQSRGLHLLTCLGSALTITTIYYLLPLGRRSPSGGVAAVVFVAGVFVVVWAVVRQVRAIRTTGGHVATLLTLFYLAVVFFAATYYVVERTWPNQFENLTTRTDALYFAVTIVATVGFGDVYAAGQAARVLVTVQMLFDIVVLGVAVTVVRSGGWGASE